MNKILAVLVLIAMSATSAAAATLNWTATGKNKVADVSGFAGSDAAFMMTGTNCKSQSCRSTVKVRAIAPDPGVGHQGWSVSGSWAYLSKDKRGAAFDRFGYILNGKRHRLSDNDGAAAQVGTFSFLLKEGDRFGWFVRSTDRLQGRAFATVAAGIAPVPVPAAGLLLLGALGMIGASRARALARA